MSKLVAHHTIISAESVKALLIEQYGLATDVSVAFLKQGINDIYLVEDESRYIFRIARTHRFVKFSRSAYEYEIEALSFLKGKGMAVSTAIPDKEGWLLGCIKQPEGERFYALFEFVEGEGNYPADVEAAKRIGKALGAFHRKARGFKSAQERGFKVDLSFLLERPLTLLQQQKRLITAEQLAFLGQLTEDIKGQLVPLINDCEQGLIQGDFWWSNCHEHEGEIGFFDFDFCGEGCFVYDLASFIGTAKGLDYSLGNGIDLALIEGYESERPLNAAEQTAIGPFSITRIIWGLGLWCTLIPMEGEQWFVKSFNEGFAQLKSLIQS